MTSSANRQLIVMRHSKSETGASSDHIRQLTDRGKADAVRAGRWLADTEHVPAHVLVSSATRAQQTFDHVSTGLGDEPEHTVRDELYAADVDDVVELCRTLPHSLHRVLVIGHNPTMVELVQQLQRRPAQEGPAHLPTSGIAVLTIPGEWTSLRLRSAQLDEEYRPAG